MNGVEWDNRPSESLSSPDSVADGRAAVAGRHGRVRGSGPDDLAVGAEEVVQGLSGLEDDLAGAVKTKTAYRFGPKRPTNPELDAITETEEA